MYSFKSLCIACSLRIALVRSKKANVYRWHQVDNHLPRSVTVGREIGRDYACNAENATTSRLNAVYVNDAYVNDATHAADATSVDVVEVPASSTIPAATLSPRHISTFPTDHW